MIVKIELRKIKLETGSNYYDLASYPDGEGLYDVENDISYYYLVGTMMVYALDRNLMDTFVRKSSAEKSSNESSNSNIDDILKVIAVARNPDLMKDKLWVNI